MRVCLRNVTVMFIGAFVVGCALLGVFVGTSHQAIAAAACKSNNQFPLTPSQYNTGACLGKVDTTAYSFEFTVYTPGDINFTVSGKSVVSRPYKLAAVNGGDTGILYVSQGSGNDAYGDPVSILVKANATCGNTITIHGTDQTSKQTGMATANPCDLIKQYKNQGIVSFALVYKPNQNGGTAHCNASKQFPLTQSAYTQACVGVVDNTQQSFEFIVDASAITNPTSVTLHDFNFALNNPPDGKPYSFTRNQIYAPGLTAGDYLSDPSGKDTSGSTVGILVSSPCHSSDDTLALTVTDASGQDSVMMINMCDLLNAAKMCKTWSFVFPMENHTTTDFSFLDYNCGNPLPSACDHPTPTKFDPYIESRYNRTECLGRLSDPSGSQVGGSLGSQPYSPGLISADLIVTIGNANPNDVVAITVDGNNAAGRLLPCDFNQNTTQGCAGYDAQQLQAMQEPFAKIGQYVYHSAPVSTITFAALYNGTCTVLDNSGCGVPPDQNKYPLYSGTGIFSDDPCDPNATIIVRASVAKTGALGSATVHVCDIIQHHYSLNVTVNLNNSQAGCMSTTRGWVSMIGFAICPLMPLITDGIQFLQNNFIVPYMSVSPLKLGG